MRSIRKAMALILALVLILACACAFAEGDEWTCPDCGAANTTGFCTKCGAKRPEAIICPDCGAEYPADTDAVFCGECGAKLRPYAAAPVRYEGEGFATPEEALTCYMEGLKNLDFEQMMRAFAWETQMEHRRFLRSMEALPETMLLTGHTDYEGFCREWFDRFFEFRSNGPMKRWPVLPEQCRKCEHLEVGTYRTDGQHYYTCSKKFCGMPRAIALAICSGKAFPKMTLGLMHIDSVHLFFAACGPLFLF